MTPRTFLRRAAVALSVLGAGGLLYAREVEPRWLQVVRLELELPRLAAAFDGYRVAQTGDLHLDDWARPDRLKRVVARVNAERPDLVVLTGDFASYSAGRLDAEELVGALRRLAAPDGVLAVLGNHDYLTGEALIRAIIHRAGLTELPNKVRTLRRGSAALHVAGVDDVMEGRSRLDLVLKDLPEAGAAVLLAHEPDFADVSAATGRFDLQLSGHSHGGQVRLPLLGRAVLPPFSQRYVRGLHKVGGMLLYVNRGLGTVNARLRLGNRPEITTLTLRSPEQPRKGALDRAAGG